MSRTPTLIPCPVGRAFNVDHTEDGHHPICQTMLQPYHGHLTSGVAEHLQTVHGMAEHDANVEATSWVDHGGVHMAPTPR